MKKPQRLGLVVEGKLTRSSFLQNPALLAQLGPVRAKSLRVARRATNFLGAGVPTESLEPFDQAQVILVYVPHESAPEELKLLAEANLTHPGKTFVLCETWCSTEALRPLTMRGGNAVTTISINTASERWIVLEGAASAVRSVRWLFEAGPDRVTIVKDAHKELLFAAELLAGVMPLQLLAQAEQALRKASMSGRHLRSLLDGVVQRVLLDAANVTHSAVRSPLRDCPDVVADLHWKALAQRHARLCSFLKYQLAANSLPELLPQSAKLEEDGQAISVEVEGA